MKKSIITDITRLIEGWKKYAPAEKFAGLSVQEFETKFEGLLDLLRVMEVIRDEYRGKIAAREGLVFDLNVLFLKIVDCIKGHKDFGRWSEFYRFLGYKTPDERRPSSGGEGTGTGNDPASEGPESGGNLPQAA